jgi:peptide/nickel transport system permease protein
VLTELVYSLHGIGQLGAQAVQDQDVPVVLGVTMFAGCFVVIANLLVDMAYAVLDPRVRFE